MMMMMMTMMIMIMSEVIQVSCTKTNWETSAFAKAVGSQMSEANLGPQNLSLFMSMTSAAAFTTDVLSQPENTYDYHHR